eukprot:3198829-Pyramimonas_sp.AAC.1
MACQLVAPRRQPPVALADVNAKLAAPIDDPCRGSVRHYLAAELRGEELGQGLRPELHRGARLEPFGG